MYEARGETKTSSELKELIRSIGDEFKESLKVNGVTYQAYLSVTGERRTLQTFSFGSLMCVRVQILLKDKKGVLKTAWGGFTKAVKKHDDSKKTGKIANKFEGKHVTYCPEVPLTHTLCRPMKSLSARCVWR
jgi:hypothetical protein